jgi:hypothetical protein
MSPRLLVFLCLLCLQQSSLAQQSGTAERIVPETCPATKPADHPFVPLVPPRPYQTQAAGSLRFWFGTDGFWTLLPANSTWSLGEKTFWFSQDWRRYHWVPQQEASKVTVTARRLDGAAPPPEVFRANGSYREQDWKAFLVGGINFPTIGCWEITGRYDDHELTFVVWVTN